MLKKLFLNDSYNDVTFELSSNIKRLKLVRLISIISIIVESIMISISLIYPENFGENLLFYRYHYIFFASLAFVAGFSCHFFINGTFKNNRRVKYYGVFFILIAIFWSASISIKDLSLGGSANVFIAFILLFTTVIAIRPVNSFFILVISEAYFLLNLPNDLMNMDNIINTMIFALFAFVISRIHYESEYKRYKALKEVQHKNIELSLLNEELYQASITDHLSGLFNRQYLDQMIVEIWNRCYQQQKKVCIMMTDINDFKSFNDKHGHIKGDLYIKNVAIALKDYTTQNNGLTFRYGGDEFCLVFEDCDYNCFDDIKEHLDKYQFEIDGEVFKVSTSMGLVAKVPDKADGAWEQVDEADKRLYRSKSKLKRRVND